MPEHRLPHAEAAEDALEQALIDLGHTIAFPRTPDLATRVGESVRAVPAWHPAPLEMRRIRRRVWLAAAVALLLLGGALLLFPETRSAIADRIGLPGVEIRWQEAAPTPVPLPAGADLQLGDAVTLEQAREAVAFPVVAPTAPELAAPAEISLLGEGTEAMISFVYPVSAALPGSQVPGVGALLTQFAGGVERNLIEKGLRGDAGQMQTHLEAVEVAGEDGFWITGAPHGVFLACGEGGDCREERYRLAGNVLLWERDGVILRFESALSKEASLAIAESVRPVD